MILGSGISPTRNSARTTSPNNESPSQSFRVGVEARIGAGNRASPWTKFPIGRCVVYIDIPVAIRILRLHKDEIADAVMKDACIRRTHLMRWRKDSSIPFERSARQILVADLNVTGRCAGLRCKALRAMARDRSC